MTWVTLHEELNWSKNVLVAVSPSFYFPFMISLYFSTCDQNRKARQYKFRQLFSTVTKRSILSLLDGHQTSCARCQIDTVNIVVATFVRVHCQANYFRLPHLHGNDGHDAPIVPAFYFTQNWSKKELTDGVVLQLVFMLQPGVYASAWGIDRMMSESPGSVMERVQTLKYFPQAVPSSMLFPA